VRDRYHAARDAAVARRAHGRQHDAGGQGTADDDEPHDCAGDESTARTALMSKFVKGDPRAGRPKGSKTRLTAQIVQDMFDSWNEPVLEGSEKTKGQAALNTLYHEQPREYARLYATTFVPKEFLVENVAGELTDDELEAQITFIREQIARSQEPKLIEVKANDESGSGNGSAPVERE
jgi:hypothetical protein